MQVSFSTVYTTVFISNILFVLAACILNKKSFLLKVGSSVLGTVLALATFRLILPLEFTFTQNVLLPKWPSLIITYFHQNLFFFGEIKITFWVLLCIVWISGIFYQLLQFIKEFSFIRKYILARGVDVTEDAPYANALSRIYCKTRSKIPFRIIMLPNIDSPMLYGVFSPRIILPNQITYSEKDLYYIFAHEALHYLKADLLIKYGLRLFIILYWWNPACYALKRQAELLIELRIDDAIVKSAAGSAREYLDCLLRIAGFIQPNQEFPTSLCIHFGSWKAGDLTKRFTMILENSQKKNYKLQIGVIVFSLLLFLSSYLFIFEAAYAIPENLEGTISLSAENAYMIQNEDGTYDLYFGGIYLETIDSLNGYSKEIPIYQSKEVVPHDTEN